MRIVLTEPRYAGCRPPRNVSISMHVLFSGSVQLVEVLLKGVELVAVSVDAHGAAGRGSDEPYLP
jgi:hypothetical protein